MDAQSGTSHATKNDFLRVIRASGMDIQDPLLIPGALLKNDDLPLVAPVGSRSIIATRS